MRTHIRSAFSLSLALVGALALSACGSSSKSSSSSAGGAKSGTITVLFGTAPDSLDPGMMYTTQGLEADQIAYVPLLAYAHLAGAAGGKLIPGLATSLPKISPDGKTYTLTLRSGLKFSNGQPVKASDFTYAVERAQTPWRLGVKLSLERLQTLLRHGRKPIRAPSTVPQEHRVED